MSYAYEDLNEPPKKRHSKLVIIGLCIAGITVAVLIWCWNRPISNFGSAFQCRLAANDRFQTMLKTRSYHKHSSPPVTGSKILILLWNGYMCWPEYRFDSDPSWHDGTVEVTYDRRRITDAHVVVVHVRRGGADRVKVADWQVLAHLSLEPTLARSDFSSILNRGQMLISYSRHSDVPINYQYGFYGDKRISAAARIKELELAIPKFETKRKDALGSFFISDCTYSDARFRLSYLRSLMQYIPLHSYGSCLHNRESEEPEGTWDVPEVRARSKLKLSGSYYFTFCMENTIMDDYVTEKFYECLQTDAIPVYLGAPNIRDYLPNLERKVIINVLDWPDPKKLAEHLQHLANKEDEYLEYFKWRTEPVLEQFESKNNFENRGAQSWISRAAQWYRDH